MSLPQSLRERVFENVRRHGWHYYRVNGGPTPPWAYTIGLFETFGLPELVLAGATYFTKQEVEAGIRALVESGRSDRPNANDRRSVAQLGQLLFTQPHQTWVNHLLLGAVDFYSVYGVESFPVLQARPTDGPRSTIDTPATEQPFDIQRERPWRWLGEEWPYALDPTTHVLTDLDALRGSTVTMVVRNEQSVPGLRWEAWATSFEDVPREIVRSTPFGTLLATDPTLGAVLDLPPGGYAARDDVDDPWRVYETSD
jgi:hypothetical protein